MFRNVKRKVCFKPVKQTDSMRMEVSSPKLAIGVRGKQEVAGSGLLSTSYFIKIIVCNDVWLDFGSFSEII